MSDKEELEKLKKENIKLQRDLRAWKKSYNLLSMTTIRLEEEVKYLTGQLDRLTYM